MTGPSTIAHHKELHERIAELEAERDYEHARAGEIADLADGYKARAENAEAEVERLKGHDCNHVPVCDGFDFRTREALE